MADNYAGMGDDLLSPARHAAAVAPNDTTNLPNASKRLWVGGAGNVKLVPAGTYLNVRAQQVFSTLTTATNIVAEY